MKCQVCDQDSGDAVLCKECFDRMQNEEIKKCKNCGKWYDTKTFCSCIIQQTTTEPQKEKQNNPGCIAAIIVLIIGAIILVCLAPSLFGSMSNNENNNQNPITSIIKDQPTVKMQQSDNWLEMLEVQFEISCPADYNKVILEMTIYDKNDIVIVHEYLSGTNYKKGNTYRLTYTMSFQEALKADHVQYKISKYE